MIAYVCQSCGGKLVLNNEKTVYNCTSCGNTYDYKFFEGLELMDSALDACARGEFTSAVNMFDFLIRKEPNNLKAMYHKCLAECKCRQVRDFNPDNLILQKPSIDFDSYFELTGEENKEFFVLLKEALEYVKSIRERNIQIAADEVKLKELQRNSQKAQHDVYKYYLPVKMSKYSEPEYIDPREYTKLGGFYAGGLAVVGFITGLPILAEDPSVGWGYVAVSVVIGLIIWGIRCGIASKNIDAIKAAEANYGKALNDIAQVKGPLEKLKDENRKDRGQISNKIRLMKIILHNLDKEAEETQK